MRRSMDIVCFPLPDVRISLTSVGKYGWSWLNPPLDSPFETGFNPDRSRSQSASFSPPPYDATSTGALRSPKMQSAKGLA